MKRLTCEMCGSTDLIKDGGVFICQACGCKYSVEEARKLLDTVKIDRTEEKQNLLLLARRAREERNSENAEKYYGMLLQENPNSWEATFFQVYYRALQCRVGEIGYYADAVGNSIQTVAVLLDKVTPEEQNAAVKTLMVPCFEIAELFARIAADHYNEYMTVKGTFEECVNTHVNTNIILGLLEILAKTYCNDRDVIIALQKQYVAYLNAHGNFLKKEYLDKTRTRLVNEISQVDTSFSAPTTNSGGCYIATAVYGSYDCPQVWTLRRFRDNTLAETWYGRAFIRTYYAISPTLVRWFGHTTWFKKMWKSKLDSMVTKLNESGVEDTPYEDTIW